MAYDINKCDGCAHMIGDRTAMKCDAVDYDGWFNPDNPACHGIRYTPHASDCATNNAPALSVGKCDCQ